MPLALVWLGDAFSTRSNAAGVGGWRRVYTSWKARVPKPLALELWGYELWGYVGSAKAVGASKGRDARPVRPLSALVISVLGLVARTVRPYTLGVPGDGDAQVGRRALPRLAVLFDGGDYQGGGGGGGGG